MTSFMPSIAGWEKWHKNFPELIEKGSGTRHTEATEPEEESGGCG